MFCNCGNEALTNKNGVLTSCSTSYARSAALFMVDGSDPRSLAGSGFDLRRRCDKVRIQGEEVLSPNGCEEIVEKNRVINTVRTLLDQWIENQPLGLHVVRRILQFSPTEKKTEIWQRKTQLNNQERH